LRQLVEGEREAGRLASGGSGVWLWTGDPRLSPALDALIESRIGRLPDGSRQVLDLLALGEPLGADVLCELVDQLSVEDVLDRGLAESTRRADALEIRLAHPLFGEAVRARTGTLRARRLRGVLATALADHGPADRAGLLHRAVLHADSDLPPDPDLLRTGAIEAATTTDVETAQRLATAARDAGGGFPTQLLLAFLLAWAVRPEAAEIEFATAELAATTDDERVRVALARTFNRVVLDSTADLDRILDAADARLTSPAARVDLVAGRALYAVLAGDLESAARHQRTVLDAPDSGAPAVAYAAWTSTMRASVQGWTAADDEILRRGYDACARSADVAPLQLNMLFWETFGHSALGEQEAAWAALDRFSGITFMTRYMVEIAQIPIELNCGRLAVVAGLGRDAMLYAPGSRGGWSAMVHALLCQASGMAGDAPGAAAAWQVSVRDHQVGFRLLEPILALAPPWLAAAEGAVTEAVRLATTAADIAFAARQRVVEMEARHAGVRFGDGSHAERLRELAALLPGPRPAATAAHAGALLAQDPDGLLAASAALADCGLVLAAADAAAQAATLERERGRSGSALRAASRAAELADRCAGARTPALVAALTPLPITSREREIATLARAGLTNKQIGERLHVSVRTVEGHVYRACTKLGVADRAALADVVGKLR
jgi:DNA-binding NarL/FixJ family response regulator